jgi:two-component system, NarL family, sensor kinase
VTEPNPVWQSVARYVASALVAVVLISLLGVLLFGRLGQDEAIRDAKDQTRASARLAIEPMLHEDVLRGDREELLLLDRIVRQRVLQESSVVRVKIWDRTGRIVYSDEARLIGARYPISPEELAEFQGDNIEAEVSDLDKPENRFERSFGELLEVYVALKARNGTPLRYEEYYRSGFIDARSRRIFREFGFISLGALVLFALIQLPLAWQLSRRVQRAQRERVDLLQRAVDASEHERRRIAADLHDGVVQNLAGVSYSLSAGASTAPPGLEPTLREAADETRQALRALRSLLVEIYPSELQREGLESALEDLLAPCAAKGLETQLEVEDGELPDDVERLFFRATQEALRNVVKHAGAGRVEVEVARRDGTATLRVEDDGSGFVVDGRPEGAHFGLRVLRDLVREIGGDLRIDSKPGRGTVVCVDVEVER